MKPVVQTNKLTSFVLGNQKKTRFQREKEERELKKKAAEQEAAQIYEDFVASFESEERENKAFVKAGSSKSRAFDPPSSSSKAYIFDDDDDDEPELPPPRKIPAPTKKLSNMEMMMLEMKEKQERRSAVAAAQAPAPAPARLDKKKGQIDSFLEEIKAKQDGTPQPSPAILLGADLILTPGSIDDGDPETTNLYVGNLAPTITEETLQEIFAQYGEIYSVKIMWPRTEEERARKRNCGFVSFMRRADAEDAKMAMHDQEVEGYRISVGWGKAIKKLSNPAAITPLVPLTDAVTGVAGAATGKASTALENADPSMVASIAVQQLAQKAAGVLTATEAPKGGGKSGKWDVAPTEMDREMNDTDEKIVVEIPESNERRMMLDRLARYVAKDGQPFEQKIREKEVANPDYAFLTDHMSLDGKYYRWRVWSLLMGDRERKWREKPFQMSIGGPFWVPPKLDRRNKEDEEQEEKQAREKEAEREKERDRQRKEREERYKYMTGRQMEKAREKERGKSSKTQLSDEEYDVISDMLRALSNSRQRIKEAMGFALDNSDCSEEIVQLLQESLTLKETPVPVKLARLYLLSDILHNSSAPVRHASSYRTHFQRCLPSIFESLNVALNNAGLGRMSAKSFEEKIMRMLTIWEGWSLYPPLFINGLEATFQRKDKDMVDIAGVEEADLDRDGLEKKAKQAGLPFTEADTAMDLLKKLTHLNKYIKAKAIGRRGELLEDEPAPSPAPAPAPVEASNSVDALPRSDAENQQTEQNKSAGVNQNSSGLLSTQPATVKPRGTWKVAGDDSESEEDVDGVPLGEDVDGVPLEDEDVDGIPLQIDPSPKVNLLGGAYGSDSDSDIDGIPIEDIRGQGSVRVNSSTDRIGESKPSQDFPNNRHKAEESSSESSSDSETDSDQDEEGSEAGEVLGSSSSQTIEKRPSDRRTHQEEEDNRSMLRKIENQIMEYRDNLERQGYNTSEVDMKSQKRRQELAENWESEKQREKNKPKKEERKESSRRKEDSVKEKKSRKHSRDRNDRSQKRSKRERSRSREKRGSSKDKKKKKSDKRR